MSPLALLLASLPALSPDVRTDPAAVAFDLPDRVLFDDTGDGAQWALTPAYKASVDADGFLYVPYLGSASELDASARFTLVSATVGGEPLVLGRAVPSRRGDALLVDRGAVVERYELALDSAEQLFEIDLGERTGELRLEVSVDTALRTPHESHAPFTFGGAGAGFRVSEAFVVDRDGSKHGVAAARTETGYALTVPAELVEAADGHLVVDPVISSTFVANGAPAAVVAVDTASISPLGFFVAVERAFGGADSDVFVFRVPANAPGPVTFVASIDISTSLWSEPAIAGAEWANEIMVVAEVNLGLNRRIYARWASADGSVVDFPMHVSPNPNAPAWAPDIGAEASGSLLAPRYCIAWHDHAAGSIQTNVLWIERSGPQPYATQVGPPSHYTSGLIAVANGAGSSAANGPVAFRVVHTLFDFYAAESIWATELDRDLALVTNTWKVAEVVNTDGISVAHANNSRLSDGSAPYVVTWDSGPAVAGEIYAATCVGGEVRGGITNVTEMADVRSQRNHQRPTIAATRDQWILTWQERPTTGFWSTVMASGDATELGFGLGERAQYMSSPGSDCTYPAVASLYEGGSGSSSGNTTFAAWVNWGGVSSIEGAHLSPVGGNVAGVQYCDANTNSSGHRAWLSAEGDSSVSSPHQVRCIDLPPSVTCILLTSRETDFVPNIGSSAGNLCLGGAGFGRFNAQTGTSDATGTFSVTFDPLQIPQALGVVPAAPGETWYFQAWFRDSGGGIPTSNLTNGVAIGFAP